MNTSQLKDQLQGFKAEFSKITRARHPLEIKHFVVQSHTSRWRQWYQLCIETDSKWAAIQEAEYRQKLAALELEELGLLLAEKKGFVAPTNINPRVKRSREIEIEKLSLEIQHKTNQFERAKTYMVGALKEIQDFLHLAKTEYKDFWGKSEDELVRNGESDYWTHRLSDQIAVDLLTCGMIQAGNLNVLLQAPEEIRAGILRQALKKKHAYHSFALPIQKEFEKLIADAGIKKLEIAT
jgi:hypothetical protein